jgi:hypothetical protein
MNHTIITYLLRTRNISSRVVGPGYYPERGFSFRTFFKNLYRSEFRLLLSTSVHSKYMLKKRTRSKPILWVSTGYNIILKKQDEGALLTSLCKAVDASELATTTKVLGTSPQECFMGTLEGRWQLLSFGNQTHKVPR